LPRYRSQREGHREAEILEGTALMTLRAIQRRLRLAGILTGVGLVVQLTTFFWNQASAFLVFAFIGAPLIFAGCATFLYSLVSDSGK
jgi:uncharacterized membrane protein HdeD (DUF308 family)